MGPGGGGHRATLAPLRGREESGLPQEALQNLAGCVSVFASKSAPILLSYKHLTACIFPSVPLSAAAWPCKDRAVLWDPWVTALPQRSYSSLIFFFIESRLLMRL